jgi:hypothetical protein
MASDSEWGGHKMSFSIIEGENAGLDFGNYLDPTSRPGPIGFDYFYNGAGVGIGDIDNDGLQDLYVTSNMNGDRLFRNIGGMEFEDVTKAFGIDQDLGWHNGVSMVDINADGFLDIYVCRSGHTNASSDRTNLLYINQGGKGFEEKAREYGLEDSGYSTQSYFFDADNDGDLDVLVLNRPDQWVANDKELESLEAVSGKEHRDRFYICEDGKYYDRSDESGFERNFGFSLSASIEDLNNDGLLDIYIANDYVQSDYYYENNGNGTFTEKIYSLTNHTPYFAMGSDFKDLDNDGFAEGMVVEMLPKDYVRAKTTMIRMLDPIVYESLMGNKYQYQYMHNSLYYNNRNGFLSDISYYSGVQSTDWSWAVLLNDFDNDGLKDMFITNGFRYDFNHRDIEDKWQEAMNAYVNAQEGQGGNEELNINELLKIVPSEEIANVFYHNLGGLKFKEVTDDWQAADPGFSNGAATADLDNDGDLDLVVNNIDANLSIYKNENTEGHYLRVKLEGRNQNKMGIGALVKCYSGDGVLTERLVPARGYLSSVEPVVHFGFGNLTPDRLEVYWPGGLVSVIEDPPVDTLISIYEDGKPLKNRKAGERVFQEISDVLPEGASHSESPFLDYHYQVLLPHKFSREGPALSVGDINNDGLDDFFLGGSKGKPGQLFLQTADGRFERKHSRVLEEDSDYEDTAAKFLDVDGDNDLDLYVASGSVEHDLESGGYQDRLYLNSRGELTERMNLPAIGTNGTVVATTYLDGDEKPEIFVGSGTIANFYPFPSSSFILKDFGDDRLVNVNSTLVPELDKIGLVRAACWTDLDGQKPDELVVSGEWMPIRIFQYRDGKYRDATSEFGLDSTNGWWFNIISEDMDGDGDMDLIAGNLGTNYKYQASLTKPFEVFSNDFDSNGTYDVVLAKHIADNRLVPIRGKDCTSDQMPFVNEKFTSFEQFAQADIDQILGREKLKGLHLKAYSFASAIFENNGDNSFTKHELPYQVQWSTARSIVAEDINEDGIMDLIIAGNMFPVEVETTRADASPGWVLIGKGDFNFEVLYPDESGFFVPGDVRAIKSISVGDRKCILVAQNDDKALLFAR